MKKLLSIALVLALILSLGATAFADDPQDMPTATINVVYDVANPGTGTTSPGETFAFTIASYSVSNAATGIDTSNMPSDFILGNVTFAEGEAGGDYKTKTLSITLPQYTSVGTYTYKVTPTVGTTAGVTYANPFYLTVNVYQGAGGLIRVAKFRSEAESNKIDEINYTYSAGSLSVSKEVTGNLGDTSKYFGITVSLTAQEGATGYAATYDVTGGSKIENGAADSNTSTISVGTPKKFFLKNGETITIANLPYGVTYTVTEDDYTVTDGYDTAVYAYSDDINKKIDSLSDTVTVTNNKEATIDTGINLDSIPYIVLLVVCLGALALFVMKKRSAREN